MRGLDPRIHRKFSILGSSWIAGGPPMTALITSPAMPQDDQLRVVELAPLELCEAGGRRKLRVDRFLHHRQSIRNKPAANCRARQRLLREPTPVRRIGKQ